MKTYKADAARISDINIFQSSIFDETGILVAHGYGRTKEEAEANADLITNGLRSRQPSGFSAVTLPVIKWLNDNCHPHVTVLITPTNAELLEGIQSIGDIMNYTKN